MNVCVVGTGYVGLVTGACLAYLNHQVVCVDIDESKVKRMQEGISPIYEPGLDELMQFGIKNGNLNFSTSVDSLSISPDVFFIAVGTPPLPDGTPDMKFVKSVAVSIARSLVAQNSDPDKFRVVVNKSTVPLGSGNWVEMLIKDEINQIGKKNTFGNEEIEKINSSFTVVSNPEFLREGTAIEDTLYADRIVVGATNPVAADLMKQLYQPIIEQSFTPPEWIPPRPGSLTVTPFLATDLTSAEMIKYAANSFLAMKISFANEIANLCELTGANIKNVANGIGLDSRIGSKFLNAGIGWGGSCFGKDVSALIEISKEYGYEPKLLESARIVNAEQRLTVIRKLQSKLHIIKGKTIGLLGLAFKPDTDDVRDAPSFDIAKSLLKMGASVKVFDPVAKSEFQKAHPDLLVEYSENIQSLAENCDALVVVTEWKEFREIDLPKLKEAMKGTILIDGRNIFDSEEAANEGFDYVGVGTPVTLKNTLFQTKANNLG